MGEIAVRTIVEDDVPAYVEAMQAGFYHSTREGMVDWLRRHIDLDKTVAAFDGGEIVGTARWFDSEITVPGGGTLPVAAVTEVTVASTHRRRGLASRMMAHERDDFVRHAVPAAMLIAAEAPIYGRFGYGMAAEDVYVTIDVPMVHFTVPTPAGSVRRCAPAELVAEAPAVYDRYRLSTTGAMRRPPLYWDYWVNRPPGEQPRGGEEFRVVRRNADGVVDGYALYRVKDEWKGRIPNCSLEIDELVAASDDAYVALWQYCTSVDWVKTVKAAQRPLLEPLPFLLADRRAATQRNRADFLWLRVVDPVIVLAARRYRAADRLVLRIEDRFGGVAAGTFALDGGPEGAKCEASLDDPHLTLDVADLSAAVLGGTRLWPAARAGRVTEHRAGAVAAFDRLFEGDSPPWCNTEF